MARDWKVQEKSLFIANNHGSGVTGEAGTR